MIGFRRSYFDLDPLDNQFDKKFVQLTLYRMQELYTGPILKLLQTPTYM